jgi:hypothetical protein
MGPGCRGPVAGQRRTHLLQWSPQDRGRALHDHLHCVFCHHSQVGAQSLRVQSARGELSAYLYLAGSVMRQLAGVFM